MSGDDTPSKLSEAAGGHLDSWADSEEDSEMDGKKKVSWHLNIYNNINIHWVTFEKEFCQHWKVECTISGHYSTVLVALIWPIKVCIYVCMYVFWLCMYC